MSLNELTEREQRVRRKCGAESVGTLTSWSGEGDESTKEINGNFQKGHVLS
jgi:hypothetical protein